MGWTNYETLRNIPKNALQVKVTGVMWKWSVEYPNGLQTDTLFVPINKPVKMDFISNDVNHNFFVPALRYKTDVIPTKQNTSWFKADQLGSIPVQCAEYCGLNHSQMNTMVVVLTDSAYNQWFDEQTQKMQKNQSDTTKISAK
jgi:cytochrome c oxidase subunit 2